MKRFCFSFALAILGLQPTVQAASTDWTEVQGGAVRLITAGPPEDGQYLAGLEFLLEPGWHTYWRAPGEAGIPPQISFSASANLKSHEVLYPVPEHYSDGFSRSIVYHDGIVLPIRIVPEDPAEDVRLNVEVFFGICKDICVPGDAILSLDLGTDEKTDSLSAKLIARDLAAVPGPSSAEDVGIRSVSLSDGKDSLVIEADVGAAAEPNLFAAGPEGSFIGLPELSSHSDGKAVWTLSTRGLSVTEDDRTLRFVLAADGSAIERLEPIRQDWLK